MPLPHVKATVGGGNGGGCTGGDGGRDNKGGDGGSADTKDGDPRGDGGAASTLLLYAFKLLIFMSAALMLSMPATTAEKSSTAMAKSIADTPSIAIVVVTWKEGVEAEEIA